MKSRDFRAKAREALGGGIFKSPWLYALLVSLIASAILGFASFTLVGAIILAGPISFGLTRYFLSLSRKGDEKNLGTLFSGFSTDFGGTLLLGLMEAIFVLLWSLLFVIPGIVKSYSYSMAFYIKADHPEYDWKQCINESKKMMHGHKWQLFCLQLSFIGWIIVGSLCLGIGTLWVTPYMYAATTSFYEHLKGEPETVATEAIAE